MHSIRADKEKNRLYLTLGKLDSLEEMMKVAEGIRDVCKDLRSGFTCLTDLRDFELLDEQYEFLISGVQEFLVDAGVSEVVRVVRKYGSWGHIQFDKTSMNVGYRGRYANDMQEAEDILDGKVD
ncbi:hypothetical protein [Desulfosudis oleivorans]|uniref:Uncharacterized protein n=1 Tax=Desulfosudis oleivorans (strain DSM 6200 / JCM 39069 / Hxd3) TaxID=96561 RepID=A9A0S3_DESOH|nr:hypothetical protein [Desulfosudis oleivorans]ABW67548.1 conserved hypothetical protein [Desulfosudis oleivorans Hxd3]